LTKFSETLADQPRWLLLNKLDMVPEEELEERCQSVIDALEWDGPVYRISAINKQGLDKLVHDLQDYLDAQKAALVEDPELADAELEVRRQIDREARENLENMRAAMRARREAAEDDDWDDDFDDDEFDVEVEYVR
jgi:GTP-binding protein